jgi:hypothetical protein
MEDSRPSAESGHVVWEGTVRGIRSTFRVKVVSGEEGEHVALEQAAAIRELLLWVRQRRLEDRANQSLHRTEHDSSSRDRGTGRDIP